MAAPCLIDVMASRLVWRATRWIYARRGGVRYWHETELPGQTDDVR